MKKTSTLLALLVVSLGISLGVDFAHAQTDDPVITLNPERQTVLAVLGYSEIGATAVDVDGNTIRNIVIDSTQVDTTTPGTYTVTYTATDSQGRTSTATRIVDVIDTTLTVDPTTVSINQGETYYIFAGVATPSPERFLYNGYIQVDITPSTGFINDDDIVQCTATTCPDPSDYYIFNKAGTYTITYTVQDSSGNSTILQRTLNVIGTASPTITLNPPERQTIEAGSTYTELGVTVEDAYGNTIPDSNITADASSVDTSILGTYTVTYTATDSQGRTSTATRAVDVIDTTPPVITVDPITVRIYTGQTYDIYTDMDASDIDENLRFDYEISPSVGLILDGDHPIHSNYRPLIFTEPGTYTIEYDIQDSSENEAEPVTRTVIVSNGDRPIITFNPPERQTIEAGSTYTELGATAIDVDGNTIPDSDITADASSIDTATLGTYLVKYTATDSQGRSSTAARIIDVIDTTPAVITVDPMTVQIITGQSYDVYTGVDISDNAGVVANIEPMVGAYLFLNGNYFSFDLSNNPYTFTEPGTYIIGYDGDDSSGNGAADVARTVIVSNGTHPTITLNPPVLQTIEVGSTYTELGATAEDADGNTIPDSNITVDASSIDTATRGIDPVTYTATDSQGRTSTATRIVNVIDTTPPVITVDPITAQINQDQAYNVLTGVDVSDNHDDNLINSINVTISPNIGFTIDGNIYTFTQAGTYTITYQINDSSRNSATQTRTVSVASTTASAASPIITLNPPERQTIEAGLEYPELGAIAVDASGNAITNIVIDSVQIDTTTPGTYPVTYTATDSQGHSSEKTRMVDVMDTTPPQLIVDPITVNINQDETYDIFTGVAASDRERVIYHRYIQVDITPSTGFVNGSDLDFCLALGCGQPTDFYTFNEAGTYTVTYTVQDSSGNSTTSQRTYIVNTFNPTMTLNEPERQTIPVDYEYTELGATAIDADGNTIPDSNITVDASSVDTTTIGTYLVTYTAKDSQDRISMTTRIVDVKDITLPVIMVDPTPTTIPQGQQYTASTVFAIDKKGNTISTFALDPFGVLEDSTKLGPGTYPIIYVVPNDDRDLARLGEIRTVTIQADTPTITPLGDNPISIAQGDRYTDYGARAIDTIGNPIPVSVDASGVDTDTAGTYEVVYTVTHEGAHYTDTRTVHVYGVNINGPSLQFMDSNQPYEELGAITVMPDGTQVASIPFDLTGFSEDELPLYPGTYPIIYYTPVSDPDVRYNFLIGFRLVFVE